VKPAKAGENRRLLAVIPTGCVQLGNMAHVEARPFLRVGVRESEPNGGGTANEASRLAIYHRSRQKVLVIGDKRPKIYPHYRSTKTGKRVPIRRRDYRAVPAAETRLDVSSAWQEPPERELSTSWLKDLLQTDGDEMCRAYDKNATEMKPVQTEWKLVHLLATQRS